MILVAILAVGLVIGALRKPRRGGYWAWGIAALVWAGFVGPVLLSAGGTLEQPEYDGLITGVVRAALNDNAWMGLYAVLALFALYGVLVWMLRQALLQTYPPGQPPA